MDVGKKKGWNRDPRTWDGRYEQRKKILDFLKNKKL